MTFILSILTALIPVSHAKSQSTPTLTYSIHSCVSKFNGYDVSPSGRKQVRNESFERIDFVVNYKSDSESKAITFIEAVHPQYAWTPSVTFSEANISTLTSDSDKESARIENMRKFRSMGYSGLKFREFEEFREDRIVRETVKDSSLPPVTTVTSYDVNIDNIQGTIIDIKTVNTISENLETWHTELIRQIDHLNYKTVSSSNDCKVMQVEKIRFFLELKRPELEQVFSAIEDSMVQNDELGGGAGLKMYNFGRVVARRVQC